jgi:hypothetical protein
MQSPLHVDLCSEERYNGSLLDKTRVCKVNMSKMGRWEDEKMGRWEDGKMGRWEDGKMGRWEDGKMGRWEDVSW